MSSQTLAGHGAVSEAVGTVALTVERTGASPAATIVLTTAIWMTWLVSDWAMWFATGNSRNGVEIAAIVAAVTAPICAFGGYVFKTFADSNKSL